MSDLIKMTDNTYAMRFQGCVVYLHSNFTPSYAQRAIRDAVRYTLPDLPPLVCGETHDLRVKSPVTYGGGVYGTLRVSLMSLQKFLEEVPHREDEFKPVPGGSGEFVVTYMSLRE